jgi:hypothetical protein
MIEFHITISNAPGIPVMTYPFPEAVPIHVWHLANEGLVHIEFEDLDALGQETEEEACVLT